MERVSIVVEQDGTRKDIIAKKASTLLDALREAEVEIGSSCGGLGKCGKCNVLVDGEQALACKICLASVRDGIIVKVPSVSGRSKILTESACALPKELSPVVVAKHIRLSKPTMHLKPADLDALRGALPGHAHVRLDSALLAKLPSKMRSYDWDFYAIVAEWDGGARLLDIVKEEPDILGIAVDIGTTTVVAQLVELSTGKALATLSDTNPQVKYGEDVHSRMMHEEEVLEDASAPDRFPLTTMIRKKLSDFFSELSNRACPRLVGCITISGNTVMTHFMHGIPTKHLMEEPWVPAVSEVPPVRASELSLAGVEGGTPVYSSPCKSSYVGGDITSGIIASGMHRSSELALLIDVGTNGEIVLGNSDWLLCASTSAGPAFEGGEVSCGMRASPGAIERARVRLECGIPKFEFTTIERRPPAGICGSGIIELVAELYRLGLVDKAGNLSSDRAVKSGTDGNSLPLVDKLAISEVDIKNIIRTKGALFAGCMTLLSSAGLKLDDIERVHVAGGFGNYIDHRRAVLIGLLPDLPFERFRFIGNASLAGSRLQMLSRQARDDAREIVKKMQNIELSQSNAFCEEYNAALFLPHTDEEKFPSAKRIMKELLDEEKMEERK